MEESLRQLWIVFIAYIGISVTVTLALYNKIDGISKKILIEGGIKKDLDILLTDVKEIKDALRGGYEKPGLITKHYELEKRVSELEESE